LEPTLLNDNTVISAIVKSEIIPTWVIGVMSIDDMLARGYTIQHVKPLETIERRRAAVDEFTDQQRKCMSQYPRHYHEYTLFQLRHRRIPPR
jgi:hypothetical protein